MASALILLLVLSLHFVVPYNVDTSHPIVHVDPEAEGSNYFGYSVSLSSGRNGVSSWSLFVGAPKFSNGTGRVYRCTGTSSADRNSSSCQPLRVDTKDTMVPGWLGASMATGNTFVSTVCAPRTLIATNNNDSGVLYAYHNLHGVCYHIRDIGGEFTMSLDPKSLRSKDHINIEYGFSVTYVARDDAAPQQGLKRAIGLPGIQTVEIEQGMATIPARKSAWVNDSDHNNFGYSVSSGYFFQSHELRYVVGGPSFLRKGKVEIFKAVGVLWGKLITINGLVIGEYFGASLATGDFDGDGRDDLAVGAPHWGEVDFGRVYIYHSKIYNDFEQGRTLQGKARKGQFGYALASADLDHNGCSDLIVSAPWEEQAGVVYVYYGRRDFREENPTAQVIQRIKPSVFKHGCQIRRFGFSLSQPTDIDGDGYPDLGVGAYKSGHAVVLRSRPVIETKIELESDPTTLQTSAEHFDVSLCVTYNGKGVPESQKLSFVIKVDALYKRAVIGPILKLDGLFSRGKRTCVKTRIYLIPSSGRNNVDPIMIDVTHSVKEGVDGSKVDPVLSRESSRSSVSRTVPINTKCKILTACRARLYVDARFGGVGADNVWVVGSGDISLNVVVRNEAEPAYDTQITIGMPPGIRLRQPIAFCKTALDALSLACDVGNPLVKETPVSFTVDLDMSEIDVKSSGATELFFNLTKSTRSIDQGVENSTKTPKLNIKHVTNVTLTGGTGKERTDYARIAEQSKVSIQHVYQVRKSGPSPITDAYLTIDVPTSVTGRNKSFLYIGDTKLMDDSGQTHKCIISDPQSKDNVLLREAREISDDDDETVFTNSGSSKTKGNPSSDDHLRVDADQTTEITVYLNCSMEGVLCKRLTCGFEFSKTHEDVINMVLNMTLYSGAFYTSNEDFLTVEFHTNASVAITSPVISDSADVRNWTASASTMLYNIPEPKKLAGWVIPLSIVLGILLFCVVAIILFRFGFFNRSRRLAAAKTKEPKLIMNLQDTQEEDKNEEPDLYSYKDVVQT